MQLPLVDSPTQTPVMEPAAPARPEAPTRVLSICLISPRFEPSYWGMEYTLPIYPGDRRSTMIAGSLPTVAGLAGEHRVTIVDENVEEIDWEALGSYDLIGVTGMNVQKKRMKEILLRLRGLGPLTVVGGPFVSVKEDYFDGLCDVKFVGEADETFPIFLADLAAGRPTQARYEQEGRTDMLKVPTPRFDLLKVDHYAAGAVQFSRGCPFQCEFCDIIVIYGRRPRQKSVEQLITELDAMLAAGFFSVFIVDDNFIGNKKKCREVLEALVEWQEAKGYPLRLMCEASINLADDPRILDLMYRANMRTVFIGIETPREASLKETKKFQNTHGDSMPKKMARIQDAGLDISAGFIVGFDNDDMEIFEDQYKFIQDNGILLAMVGMLGAIPSTPLYKRLEKEGRLVDDPNLNFVPKQMTRKELQVNYWELVRRLYTPEAFLDRYFKVHSRSEYLKKRAAICKKANEGKLLPTLGYGLILLLNLVKALAKDGSLTSIGKVYLKYFFTKNLRYRRDAVGFAQFVNRCATHWHFYKFTREARAGLLRTYNSG